MHIAGTEDADTDGQGTAAEGEEAGAARCHAQGVWCRVRAPL